MQHYASIYKPEPHRSKPPEILASTAREAAQYICDALVRVHNLMEEEGDPCADHFVYFAAVLQTCIDHGSFGE